MPYAAHTNFQNGEETCHSLHRTGQSGTLHMRFAQRKNPKPRRRNTLSIFSIPFAKPSLFPSVTFTEQRYLKLTLLKLLCSEKL